MVVVEVVGVVSIPALYGFSFRGRIFEKGENEERETDALLFRSKLTGLEVCGVGRRGCRGWRMSGRLHDRRTVVVGGWMSGRSEFPGSCVSLTPLQSYLRFALGSAFTKSRDEVSTDYWSGKLVSEHSRQKRKHSLMLSTLLVSKIVLQHRLKLCK